MNEDFKKKWVEALRSGKYPQARGHLRTDSGYCCLGVALDLINPNNWKSMPCGSVFGWGDGTYLELPPRSQWELHTGLQQNDPAVLVDGKSITLTSLNDEDGLSFEQIAAYIETQL